MRRSKITLGTVEDSKIDLRAVELVLLGLGAVVGIVFEGVAGGAGSWGVAEVVKAAAPSVFTSTRYTVDAGSTNIVIRDM